MNSEVNFTKTKQDACCKLRVSMYYTIWKWLITYKRLFRQMQQEQNFSLDSFVPTVLLFPKKSYQSVTLKYFVMYGRSNTCSPLLC